MTDQTNARDNITASLVRRAELPDALKTLGVFHVECVGADGKVKWRDTAHNVVTTQGKNAMLDKFLGIGTAYAAIVMGLHTTVGNAASTYATPSPQVEPNSTLYGAVRPSLAAAFSAAAAGVKSTSSAISFSIAASFTVTGCFVATGAAGISVVGDVGTAAAILFSSGAFSVARAVVSGDTLNVTYSLTLT